MTYKYDPYHPAGSFDQQVATQQRAASKRARKAAKRRRDAELTALGREVSKAWARHPWWEHAGWTMEKGRRVGRIVVPHVDVQCAMRALAARRRLS